MGLVIEKGREMLIKKTERKRKRERGNKRLSERGREKKESKIKRDGK